MSVVEAVTGVPALITLASSRPFVAGNFALLASGNNFLARHNKSAKTALSTYASKAGNLIALSSTQPVF